VLRERHGQLSQDECGAIYSRWRGVISWRVATRFQPLKERIVKEVGYGLSLEGADAADLVKSMRAESEKQAR